MPSGVLVNIYKYLQIFIPPIPKEAWIWTIC